MSFEKIKKNFGFGCMRLPMLEGEVDYTEFNKMIDFFMESGFNYFDTAHGYIDGKSEKAIKECLTKRYPREDYVLANKLSGWRFDGEEVIIPLFEKLLQLCGVEYFDFYLFHCLNKEIYQKHLNCNSFEIIKNLKEQGRIRHIAISFHDTADVLDKILSEQPCIEAVQLQINYLDYDDPAVQSKACYDVAVKHRKKVIVMEPVKGGSLVNLPDSAQAVFDQLNGGSAASYAIRFAAGFEGVEMVLSGMGTMEMMEENTGFMKEFTPLNQEEQQAVNHVCSILDSLKLIACTTCRYCVDGCPQKIRIPDLFSCLNNKNIWKNWNADYYYGVHTSNNGKAKDCIGCKKCEQICPQQLPISELLKTVSKEFDK